MILESDAFADGGDIPRRYTCDGADTSPPLSWRELPEGTETLALVMSDPDAPAGTWIHWVLFDVPATGTGLPENASGEHTLPGASREGMNGWGRRGYGGPCPPRGTSHRYVFKLYALDRAWDPPSGADAAALASAAESHALEECVLTGHYERARA